MQSSLGVRGSVRNNDILMKSGVVFKLFVFNKMFVLISHLACARALGLAGPNSSFQMDLYFNFVGLLPLI